MEIEAGAPPQISGVPSNSRPVSEYLAAQGHFDHLMPETVAARQHAVEQEWRELLSRASPQIVGSNSPVEQR
jgi:hypothetical protein